MPVHFFIDNLAHGGLVISTYEVLRPEYVFNVNDAGTCSWNLALSQKDITGVPIAQDEFAPKATDWRLRGNDGTQNLKLQAGRLLDVGLDSDTGLLQCSGKDWLEYLDQPYYFGTTTGDGYQASIFTLADNISQVVKAFVQPTGLDDDNVTYGATQQKVINHILGKANQLSDIQYSANYAGTGWSEIFEYEIQFLDPTTLLGHIQAVSDYASPLGFDFWCDWDKTIYFRSPRTVLNPSSVVPLFDLVYGVGPVVKATWHNSGPKATRTVGKNSRNLWKERSYAPSISAYRDFVEVVDLGQKYDFGTTYGQIQNRVDVATDSIGTFDWNPQKDLTLTLIPNLIFPFSEVAGHLSMVGQPMKYDSGNQFMPYHRINATYYIVSQRYYTDDDSGNYLLDLGLQQIYAT